MKFRGYFRLLFTTLNVGNLCTYLEVNQIMVDVGIFI